ncbi:hypothetical protein [Nocardia camponoti]|uniref:hypothetical protein n=1 Tax=Nocardia camponoti TaxID=1616106 RepID=UPI001E36DD87|nr:hypothetical protein [Nocardia camponoti]
MLRDRGATAAGEQAEAVIEAVGELVERHRPQACCREFDGERDAVERTANAFSRCEIRSGDSTTDGSGAVAQQGDGGRQLKRPHPPQCLARNAKRLTACRENAHAWTLTEDPMRERSGGVDHVLAVVQHQQRFAFAQCGDEPIKRVSILTARMQ